MLSASLATFHIAVAPGNPLYTRHPWERGKTSDRRQATHTHTHIYCHQWILWFAETLTVTQSQRWIHHARAWQQSTAWICCYECVMWLDITACVCVCVGPEAQQMPEASPVRMERSDGEGTGESSSIGVCLSVCVCVCVCVFPVIFLSMSSSSSVCHGETLSQTRCLSSGLNSLWNLGKQQHLNSTNKK